MGNRLSSNKEIVQLLKENEELREDRFRHHNQIRTAMLRRLREDSKPKTSDPLMMFHPVSVDN